MNRKRKNIKKNIFRIILLCTVLFAIFFISKATLTLYEKNSIARESRNEAEERFVELENRFNELSSDVSKLQTERGIEAEIRKKFQVSRSGEYAIVLLDPKTEAEELGESSGFWDSFINFFK